MDTDNEPTLSFIAAWFDSHPQVTKRYLLKYYINTREIVMKDTSTGRKFLKRTKVDNESLTKEDFYIGATIVLFSRDLKLIDYGDNNTRELLDSFLETSILVLTPNVCSQVGGIIKSVEEAGLSMVNLKSFNIEGGISSEMAITLGLEQGKNEHIHDDMNYYIAVEFRGKQCVERLITIVSSIQQQLEQTTREIFASSNFDEVKKYRDLFLKCKNEPMAKYGQIEPTTCCVIKPHVIKAYQAGAIIDDILSSGCWISRMQVFYLDRTKAGEFYEVYKTAVKEYNKMVDELCSGPVVALEVRSDVVEFRDEVAGPWNVDMAKNLQPDTIRAKYGKSRIQNAIHCTDLPGENINELTYFFDILCNAELE